jgi:hypothetical protein
MRFYISFPSGKKNRSTYTVWNKTEHEYTIRPLNLKIRSLWKDAGQPQIKPGKRFFPSDTLFLYWMPFLSVFPKGIKMTGKGSHFGKKEAFREGEKKNML